MTTTFNCLTCGQPIEPNEVRVHFDPTGTESAVDPQPSHLKCYLDVYDPGLSTNAAIKQHVYDKAVDALGMVLGR